MSEVTARTSDGQRRIPMDPFELALAATIRAERAAARIGHEEFADAAGISAPTLWRIEHGERHVAAGVLRRMALTLGITLPELTALAEERFARTAEP